MFYILIFCIVQFIAQVVKYKESGSNFKTFPGNYKYVICLCNMITIIIIIIINNNIIIIIIIINEIL